MAKGIRTKKELDKIAEYQNFGINLKFYDAMRTEFNTGDLIFFSGNHWLSGLIRWKSKSAWSHVGMVIRIEEMDRLFLVESILESGVRLLPMSFLYKNYSGNNRPYDGRVAWARHAILGEDIQLQNKIREFCMDNLTKQYDRKEYFRILWRSLVGMKSLFEDDKYTCSEYVYEAYKYAGVDLPKEKGVFISPGAFWRQEYLNLKAILI
jgi:uncharacterized protein YycO